MAGKAAIVALALALISGSAVAQDGMAGMAGMAPTPAACAATDAALPPGLTAWTAKSSLNAAAKPGELSSAVLVQGRAFAAALRPAADLTYAAAPEKAAGAGAYGGLFALDVDAPGTWRIALGAAPWIDVLKDGQPVASSAHAHGPACSSVRKMVDFPLTPGRYVIQVSGAADPKLAIMAVRLP